MPMTEDELLGLTNRIHCIECSMITHCTIYAHALPGWQRQAADAFPPAMEKGT